MMKPSPDAHDPIIQGQDNGSCPFEGPEKLLEIWFERRAPHSSTGLRTVDRLVWEEMLSIVKCKVLSVINGREMDAYLLSESSFFVFPHKLILKTCGTTLNLLGLPRILAIAKEQCGYEKPWRCFYSRKSFMFPERQIGPHREWREEVEYLDSYFDDGAAYTVGKFNSDHWLLYITSPPDEDPPEVDEGEDTTYNDRTVASVASSLTLSPSFLGQDYTIELLMTKLAAPARRPFFFPDLVDYPPPTDLSPTASSFCSHRAAAVSSQLGIDSIFPSMLTKLDSYAFEPCGYSANGLVGSGEQNGGEGYYTIHVTPEEGWSYASFECNVPVKPTVNNSREYGVDADIDGEAGIHETPASNKVDQFPDLETLVQRVVDIFQPGHLSLTLFVSSSSSNDKSFDGESDIMIESAHKVFRQALIPRGYKRTDKINYEFGDYDLAFATFQKK
ncbi:hypothetical protein BS47DRAFT_83764 [Hydnum rufescens UP504]|uniref:adenosylmethionine decarboxylase n=1 Tax=Hydnum rufescens UP504 TaxID=1448309 RepID=A0A9P6B7P3_9AGAM|nr:hypothetical protein BS47DRAFT_83764 [Hydnum rufescens UP504]